VTPRLLLDLEELRCVALIKAARISGMRVTRDQALAALSNRNLTEAYDVLKDEQETWLGRIRSWFSRKPAS
jgi:hypothetical protein